METPFFSLRGAMKLLRAVNKILGQIGENPVTTVESKNPTVSVILQALEDENYETQTRGWWFNQHKVELSPDIYGQIKLPERTIDWEWIDHPTEVRGDYLLYTPTMTQDFRKVNLTKVTGIITNYIDFEDLPYSYSEWVTARAGIRAYSNDVGMDDVVNLFIRREEEALTDVMNKHLRHKEHSTRKSKMYRRMVRHNWR